MAAKEDLELVECAAYSLGLISKDVTGPGSYKPFRLTLSPSPIPKEFLEEVCDLQPHFNALIDSISRDVKFLRESLKKTIEVDEFTRKLFEIYEKRSQCKPKPIVMGKYRCDYMVHCEEVRGTMTFSIKQVEINTISVAFGASVPAIVEFHRVMNAGLEKDLQPESSNSLEMIVDAFAEAHKCYGKENAVVLTVICEDEANIMDQRKVDIQLWKKYQIRTIRYTLTQLYKLAKHGADSELLVDETEVSVVYFRAGYSLDQYHSADGAEWKVRLLLETSSAVCIPSVDHQLVGLKKVQQLLAAPGTLERFIKDENVVKRMKAVFAGLYTLDLTPEGDQASSIAINDPHKFVLKPQKEGGGNNFYGEDLKAILQKFEKQKEREQFILMDMIRAPKHRTTAFVGGALRNFEVIPEFSIFGLYIRHNDKVVMNQSVPYLVRAKTTDVNEAGVSHGHGILDSLSAVSSEVYKHSVICPPS